MKLKMIEKLTAKRKELRLKMKRSRISPRLTSGFHFFHLNPIAVRLKNPEMKVKRGG